jgi:hypothetical protein
LKESNEVDLTHELFLGIGAQKRKDKGEHERKEIIDEVGHDFVPIALRHVQPNTAKQALAKNEKDDGSQTDANRRDCYRHDCIQLDNIIVEKAHRKRS